MKLVIALASAATLAGCVLPQATQGSVYAITDQTVTIRGAFDMSLASGPAKPTEAMIAQAREICPGARYVSANPTPSDTHTFLYLFRCP
jgi:ABC-type uncharacterized transport system auxiliary subunit